eukprot:2590353-Pleurochrysis_carterae.AAC.1
MASTSSLRHRSRSLNCRAARRSCSAVISSTPSSIRGCSARARCGASPTSAAPKFQGIVAINSC